MRQPGTHSGGGGIAHRGLSNTGTIERNTIAFNEVFQGDKLGPGLEAILGGGGGGIEIAGALDPDGGLTEGAGNVTIDLNLIQGNYGGTRDGGGIALRSVNGGDLADTPWTITVDDNIIINNVTGHGGGGIALQDAIQVLITRNTIADNDSTATSIFAGLATPETIRQPAGIVSRANSANLQAMLPGGSPTYSEPAELWQNLLFHNRAFTWDFPDAGNAQGGLLPDVASGEPAVYWDLGVVGTVSAECLEPTGSVITEFSPLADPAGCIYSGNGNIPANNNSFVDEYFNELFASAAADEGGNFVQVYYTPLSLTPLESGPPPNNAPVVTITNPSNGATFTPTDSIAFTGTASDVEEPGITGADLSWTSSIDGAIGNGASFSTTLTVGIHTITASVTDGGALPGSDSITVNITAAPAPTADTLTCVRVAYNLIADRLEIGVQSDDLPQGNRIITGVIDMNGDGFGGADDYNIGIIPVFGLFPDHYVEIIQPFPDPNPTEGTSIFRATSDLGGTCTKTVD